MVDEEASSHPPLPPLPVFAEIFQISGRKNCNVRMFALENGIFRCKNRPGGKPKSSISLCRSRSDLLALQASNLPAVHAAGRDCCSRWLRPSRALHGFFDSLCSAQFAELFMCLRAPAAYAICSPAAPMHCKTICQHSAKLCLTG